jgi:TetR/AcrR family transcriptional repressor of nem operon
MIPIIIIVKPENSGQEAAMRVSREQMAETHEQIVDAAARLFRAGGFDGVSVDAVMQQAGLTHGGFYRHFRSKDELAAAALRRALERGAARMEKHENLGAMVADYLSERHCHDRGNGCAITALGGDMARQGKGVRAVLTAHLRRRLERIARLLRGGTEASRRRRAIAALSGMVGALTLARAVDDPDLAAEILASARASFGDG